MLLQQWEEEEEEQEAVLDGSNMRRIVPETHAVLRGTTNSKPSPETRVTNSSADADILQVRAKRCAGIPLQK